jgi:hypothetical protein
MGFFSPHQVGVWLVELLKDRARFGQSCQIVPSGGARDELTGGATAVDAGDGTPRRCPRWPAE